MPFDALVDQHIAIPVATNSLEAIGVEPIERDEAVQHKIRVVEAFAASSPYKTILVETGRATWLTCRVKQREDAPRLRQSLRFRMLDALPLQRDCASIPQEVVDLAKLVETNISDVKLSIDVFDEDPILNACYVDGHGARHNDCLAIWDGELVIALAKRTMRPGKRSLWNRVIDAFRLRSNAD